MRATSTTATTSALATTAPPTRPARKTAGQMPTRFRNEEEGQSSRRQKYTPVRGRGGRGKAKHNRIMSHFTCSRGGNDQD